MPWAPGTCVFALSDAVTTPSPALSPPAMSFVTSVYAWSVIPRATLTGSSVWSGCSFHTIATSVRGSRAGLPSPPSDPPLPERRLTGVDPVLLVQRLNRLGPERWLVPQRGVRQLERVFGRRDRDGHVGGHPGEQLQLGVGEVDDHVVGDHD